MRVPKKKTKEAKQMHAHIAVGGVQDLDSGENIFSKAASESEEWSIGTTCFSTLKAPWIRFQIPDFC